MINGDTNTDCSRIKTHLNSDFVVAREHLTKIRSLAAALRHRHRREEHARSTTKRTFNHPLRRRTHRKELALPKCNRRNFALQNNLKPQLFVLLRRCKMYILDISSFRLKTSHTCAHIEASKTRVLGIGYVRRQPFAVA